jgi:DNA-binding NarL/FixJ family response regulator
MEANMQELWKVIKGFQEYQVSDCGNVMGKFGRILKPKSTKRVVYKVVSLYKGKKRFQKLVHRLVLEHECNHIDGNKLNNHINNLEWCTRSENMKHAFKIGLWESPSRPGNIYGIRYSIPKKLTEEKVKRILKLIKNGVKLKPIAEYFGVSVPTVSEISHGKKWKHVDRN